MDKNKIVVLGETGRFPLLIKALIHTIMYEWQLQNRVAQNSLIGLAYAEMKQFCDNDKDCWLFRINTIKSSLNINNNGIYKKSSANKYIKKQVKSMFQAIWLDSIQQINLNSEGRDQTKLRLYKTFKGSFSEEPYISLVTNRNQRAALTRLRVSAHHLQIEVGRYNSPPTPVGLRFCRFCYTEPQSIDTEFHFLFECSTFHIKRQCFLGKLSSLGIKVEDNWSEHFKLASVLCPTSAKVAKCVNKYITIMERNRKLLDEGTPINHLGYRNPPIVEGEYKQP